MILFVHFLSGILIIPSIYLIYTNQEPTDLTSGLADIGMLVETGWEV